MNDTNPHQESAQGSQDAVKGREALQQILTLMGLELSVETDESDGRITFDIVGDETETLIGNKGQTLDALQFILGRILGREREGRTPLRVDCGGYRERRQDALIDMAQQLGEKSTQTGKIVVINPMSAHDRRIVHMTLKDTPGISTSSEGEGSERRVLIIPAAE